MQTIVAEETFYYVNNNCLSELTFTQTYLSFKFQITSLLLIVFDRLSYDKVNLYSIEARRRIGTQNINLL